jgi:hypothetical protein
MTKKSPSLKKKVIKLFNFEAFTSKFYPKERVMSKSDQHGLTEVFPLRIKSYSNKHSHAPFGYRFKPVH